MATGSSCRSLTMPDRAYDIEIQGAVNRAMRRDILALSDAAAYQHIPAGGLSALQRRVAGDADLIRRYLRSRGYYGAQVQIQAVAGPKRPKVLIQLSDVHPFFVASSVCLLEPPPDKAFAVQPLQQRVMGSFSRIEEMGQELRREVQNQGYPLATVVSREVIADHAEQEVTLRYVIDPGPPARFGPVFVDGLKHIVPAFVLALQPWEEGDAYRLEDIEEYRRRLARAGLFSTIEIIGADQVSEDEVYALMVRLTELRRMAVRAGLDYRTDQGLEVSAGWLYRNLTGRGERLDIEGIWSAERRLLETTLRLPQLRNPRQSLVTGIRFEEEQRAAYFSRSTRGEARMEKEWSRWIATHAGAAVRFSDIEDRRIGNTYRLLSLPLRGIWNTRNDAMDPTRGFRLQADAEPFLDVHGQPSLFLKARGSGTGYLPLLRHPSVLLALRATVGSITGASLRGIPADERFYTGGAQSIRGYAYESIGPRANGEPIGGRSLTETSLELRGRWKQFGGVLFLDGGQTFSSPMMGSPAALHWGAGIGLRYFTPLGPVRADVGVPLNPPDYVDGKLHFYLSIGQAF